MKRIDLPRAGCLTPPTTGGVAVIQLIGPPERVDRCLFTRPAVNPADLINDRVRLRQWVDGEEIVDDALISMRDVPDGLRVYEISVHGGPRIVQRILLQLRQAGVEVVGPASLLPCPWQDMTVFQAEVSSALIEAPTRAVVRWLARMADEVPQTVERLIRDLDAGMTEHPGRTLRDWLQAGRSARYLTRGVRAVITGAPNAGKSTLANALAGRDHAVVSEFPGTTRDWVEHLGAVEGVPFAFIDTAGNRSTDDPLEQEAIRRTGQQLSGADLILEVTDASAPVMQPPPSGDGNAPVDPADNTTRPPRLLVWNKSDLLPNAGGADLAGDPIPLRVSALTGEGLPGLRAILLTALGIESDWELHPAPFTSRQIRSIELALSVLDPAAPDCAAAIGHLKGFMNGNPSETAP